MFNPSDAISASNKFAAIHELVANALTLFEILKYAECALRQSLVPRELYLPATRSLSLRCLDSGARCTSPVRTSNMGANEGVCSDFWDT